MKSKDLVQRLWFCPCMLTFLCLTLPLRFQRELTLSNRDVSNEKSVDDGIVKVLERFPQAPIGGIAFGPLVLQDVLLKDMDFQMMQMVLKPKAEGARILHERFSSLAKPLDFFVMFSSIVTVLGNPGQANYGAANAYLQALAQQRRSIGLVVSTYSYCFFLFLLVTLT